MLVRHCDNCLKELGKKDASFSVRSNITFPLPDDRVDVDLCRSCAESTLQLLKLREIQERKQFAEAE